MFHAFDLAIKQQLETEWHRLSWKPKQVWYHPSTSSVLAQY